MARIIELVCVTVLVGGVAGCASVEHVQLSAAPGQEAIVRNGVPALISQKQNLVMLRPNSRQIDGGSRPAFTVAVLNMGKQPATLQETDIRAEQTLGTRTASIRIYRYDELVQQEKDRQTLQTVAAVLGGVGGVMSAANAGYVRSTGSVYANGQVASYSATTYDPLRAQMAQNHAMGRAQADIAAAKAQGEANLDALQATILKDHTVMPGEWYGGTIVLQSLETPQKGLTYTVAVVFAGEEHRFSVTQGAR